MAQAKKIKINRVNPKGSAIGYTSNYYGAGKPVNKSHDELYSQIPLDWLNTNGIDKLEPIQTAMGLTDKIDIGLHSTSKGIKEIKQNNKVTVFDTETLGNWGFQQKLSGEKVDFNDIVQASMKTYSRNNNGVLVIEDSLDLAIQISDNTFNKSKNLLKQLNNDPRSWNRYTESQKRSLIDLILYSNEKNIVSKTINGQTVQTLIGQVTDRPSTKASMFEIINWIPQMQKGLDIAYTKFTPKNVALQAMNIMFEKGGTPAGYNINAFDIPVIEEYFGDSLNGTTLERKLTGNVVDVYNLQKVYSAGNPSYSGKDNTLESAYSHLFGNTVQQHNAGTDVDMTAKVLEKHLQDKRMDLFNFETKEINPNEIFVAKEGIQRNPSPYNQGEFLYSGAYGQKGTKYIKEYNYNAQTIVKSHSYSILGKSKADKINGIQYYAFGIQDLTNDTTNIFFSQNPNYLEDLFGGGIFVPESKMTRQDREFVYADRARRSLDKIFKGQVNYSDDDVYVKLNTLLDISDDFKQYNRGRVNKTSLKRREAFIEDRYNKALTAWRRSGSNPATRPLRSTFETAVTASPFLQENKNILIETIKEVNQRLPFQEGNQTRQNQRLAVLNNVYLKIKDNYEEASPVIGRSSDKMLPINLSVNGELTYLNVSSPTKFSSTIKNMGTKKHGETHSQVVQRLNMVINQFEKTGGPDAASIATSIRLKIQKDIKENGKILPTTLDSISGSLYAPLSNNPAITTGMYGNKLISRYAGVGHEKNHATQLKKATPAMAKKLVADSIEQMEKSVSNGRYIRGNIFLNQEMLERLEINEGVKERIEQHMLGSQKIFNLDQGEARKATNNLKIKEFDVKQAIADVITTYEKNNFNVSLQLNKDTNQMELFFAPSEAKVNFINKNRIDLLNNKNVGHVVLPLYTETLGLDSRIADITGGYTGKSKNGKYTLISKQEELFDTLIKNPEIARRKIMKDKSLGKTIDYNQIVSDMNSHYEKQIGKNSSAIAYGTGFNRKFAERFSPEKSLVYASYINVEDMMIETMRMKDVNQYNRWIEYKGRNRNASLLNASSFWANEKRNFKDSYKLEDLRMITQKEFKDNTGFELFNSGMSVSSYQRGNSSLIDPMITSPLSSYGKALRETGVKSVNYIGMREDVVEARLREEYMAKYSKVIKDKRLLQERVEMAVKRNMAITSSGLSGLNERTIKGDKITKSLVANVKFVNDVELHKEVKNRIKELDVEVAELIARNNILATTSSEYKRNQARINLINEAKAKAQMFSAHEGQQLMREGFANSMIVDTVKDVVVGKNESLPEELLKQIARLNEIKYEQGMSLDMKNGEYIELEGMTGDELRNIGLLDEKGQLVVGEIVQTDDLLSDGEYSSYNFNSKKMNGEVSLNAIYKQDDKYHLIFNQKEKVITGSKTMWGEGQGRNSNIIISDEIWDVLGFNGIDVITEHGKLDRQNLDGFLLTYFNTAQHNIREELETIDFRKVKDIDSLDVSPALKRSLKDMQTRGIDLQNTDMSDILLEAMSPAAKDLGWDLTGKNAVGYIDNEQGGLYVLNHGTLIKGDSALDRAGNVRTFVNRLSDEYNVSEEHMKQNIVKHKVFEYSGSTTRANYSYREFDLMKTSAGYSGNDIIIKRFEQLRKQYGRKDDARYASDLINMLSMSEESIKEATTSKGNVILDMSGRFEADKSKNFYINDDGVIVVDGLSLVSDNDSPINNIKDVGNIQLKNNTLTDDELLALGLPNDEFSSISINDYQKVNPDAKIVMKIQDETSASVRDSYLPIVRPINSSDSLFDTPTTRVVEGKLSRVFDLAKENSQYGDSNGYIRNQINQSVNEYYETSELFVTNSKPGSTVKSTVRYESATGGTYSVKAYNQLAADEAADALRQQNKKIANNTVVLNRKTASEALEGLEATILQANNVTLKDLNGANPMDYILDRLDINEDGSFKVFNMLNRSPNQTTGNLLLSQLKIDDNVGDNNIYVTREIAKSFSGDYDGDHAPVSFDFYRKTNGYDYANMQKELNKYSSYEELRLSKLGTSAEDNINESLFNTIKNATDEDLVNVAKALEDQHTYAHRAEDILGMKSKGIGIGQTDNLRMKQLGLVQNVYGMLREEGLYTDDFINSKIQTVESTMSEFLQSFISTKKRDASKWGITSDSSFEEVLSNANKFDNESQEILNAFTSRSANPTRIAQMAVEKGYIANTPEAISSMEETLDIFKMVNSFVDDTGIDTSPLSIGLSQGQTNNALITGIQNANVENVLMTETALDYISEISPSLLSAAKEERKRQADLASNYLTMYNNQKTGRSILSDSADALFDEMSNLTNNQRLLNSIKKNESISEALQSGFSRVANSSAFKIGAGIAGVWLLSSMTKGGPTPEGNEAQQEATALEVAPAALLTSPTARVTPRGENITVNISGTGRVDNETVAGIVNSTLSQQMGMTMNMNLYQSDNTQTLDNTFYEEKISKALGLN